MVVEERGDYRYQVFVEMAPGWVPASPDHEFESEPGAVKLAQDLRANGDVVLVEKFDASTGEFIGTVLF